MKIIVDRYPCNGKPYTIGRVPRLQGVRGFAGVLIHVGNLDKK